MLTDQVLKLEQENSRLRGMLWSGNYNDKQRMAEHDAEVIEKIKTKWIGIFEQENEVYTSVEIIDALDHEINQLRQKVQEINNAKS